MMKRNQNQLAASESVQRVTEQPITSTESLTDALSHYAAATFVAVDTEFMREKTYYPQLCLIQISDGNRAFAIDPLADGLDLTPLWALMKNDRVTKVFHAGGQDMEIFLHLIGSLPTPIYDTQLAAMVCGLGDQVGYDKLVMAMLGHEIDKTSRFTDWSK
ncbi:MAG: ribonuclease D, partial [Candidatus Puniceispirillum sp.]